MSIPLKSRHRARIAYWSVASKVKVTSKCFMISSLLPASNIVSSLLKRMFVSLKDMEPEDADKFLTCEFNGYNFVVMV